MKLFATIFIYFHHFQFSTTKVDIKRDGEVAAGLHSGGDFFKGMADEANSLPAIVVFDKQSGRPEDSQQREDDDLVGAELAREFGIAVVPAAGASGGAVLELEPIRPIDKDPVTARVQKWLDPDDRPRFASDVVDADADHGHDADPYDPHFSYLEPHVPAVDFDHQLGRLDTHTTQQEAEAELAEQQRLLDDALLYGSDAGARHGSASAAAATRGLARRHEAEQVGLRAAIIYIYIVQQNTPSTFFLYLFIPLVLISFACLSQKQAAEREYAVERGRAATTASASGRPGALADAAAAPDMSRGGERFDGRSKSAAGGQDQDDLPDYDPFLAQQARDRLTSKGAGAGARTFDKQLGRPDPKVLIFVFFFIYLYLCLNLSFRFLLFPFFHITSHHRRKPTRRRSRLADAWESQMLGP
jgi:hypothetical protein